LADQFYIAQPPTGNADCINLAPSSEKHVIFTPGTYRLDDALFKIISPGR
jgi:hypothetical protein